MKLKRNHNLLNKFFLFCCFAFTLIVYSNVNAASTYRIPVSNVTFRTGLDSCETRTTFSELCYHYYTAPNGVRLYFSLYPKVSPDSSKTYTSVFSKFSTSKYIYSEVEFNAAFINLKIGDGKAFCLEPNKEFDPTTAYYIGSTSDQERGANTAVAKAYNWGVLGNIDPVDVQAVFWFLWDQTGTIASYGGANPLMSRLEIWEDYYRTIKGTMNSALSDVNDAYFFYKKDSCKAIKTGSIAIDDVPLASGSKTACENVSESISYDGHNCKLSGSWSNETCYARVKCDDGYLADQVKFVETSGDQITGSSNERFWSTIYSKYTDIVAVLMDMQSKTGLGAFAVTQKYRTFCEAVNVDGYTLNQKIDAVRHYNDPSYAFFTQKVGVPWDAFNGMMTGEGTAWTLAADNIASAVNNTSTTNHGTVWKPSNSSAQYIISEPPDNLDISCTNFLGAVKDEFDFYSRNQAGINALENNQTWRTKIDTIYSMYGLKRTKNMYRFPSCHDKSCYNIKTIVSGAKKVNNPNYNPKLKGSRQFKYAFGMVTKVTTNLCECDYFKYNPSEIDTYFGSDWTCEGLMQEIDGIKKCVKTPEKTTITCQSGNTDGGTTCELLLPQYDGLRTRSEFNTFKSKISDSYKARFYPEPDDDNVGTITCKPIPDCKPKVNTKNAACKAKATMASTIYLSDAVDDNQTPDKTCYQKNYAYNLSADIVASKDENFSKSKYCDVYCWEDLTVTLPYEPSALNEILAGQLFFWGLDWPNNIFARLEPKRVCWTKPDYTTFNADWAANEAAITKAKEALDNQVAYNAKSGAENKGECVYADNTSTTSRYCNMATDDKNHCSVITPSDGKVPDWCSCTTGSKEYGTRYVREAVGSGDTASSSYDQCLKDTTPSESDIDNDAEESSRRSTLESLVDNRNKLKSAILACQSDSVINTSTIYNYSAAKMSIQSNDQLNNKGVQDYNLVGSVESSGYMEPYDTTATISFGCTGNAGEYNVNNPCAGNTYLTIKKFDEYYWDWKGGSYVFKYNDDFVFYALKENSHIVNKHTYPDNIGDRELSYVLGYGIPTAFTMSTGYFNIGVTMSGFGNTDSSGKAHFDKVTENGEKLYKYDFHKYECPYFVRNELYLQPCNYSCDPATLKCTKVYDSPAYCCEPGTPNCNETSGLSVVYRLIDMASGNTSRIFPSVDGDGRTPGRNWFNFANGRQLKYKNITTYSKIYDQTPMYKIELNPTNIGVIRASNKTYREDGKDPYTSYKDTTNAYKITCKHDGEAKTCVSSYITELIRRNIITGGNMKIESEGQRIAKLYNYKSCYDVANPHC